MADDLAVAEPPASTTPFIDIPICPVCYEKFHVTRLPRIFPKCGHLFCMSCITSVCKSAPNAVLRGVACPSCREISTIKSMDRLEEMFPLNYFLKECIERLENSAENNKMYNCKHCKKQFHEKHLTCCDPCAAIDPSGCSELDFLNRQNTKLLCEDCVSLFHFGPGHSYIPVQTVTGRWNHRFLFKLCSKKADEERKKIDDVVASLEKSIEFAKKQKQNLNETVRQMESNAGHSNIKPILGNFIKGMEGATPVLDSIHGTSETFRNPNSWNDRSVDKLFRAGSAERDGRVADASLHTGTYKAKLEYFFKEGNSRSRQKMFSSYRAPNPSPEPRLQQFPPMRHMLGFQALMQAALVPEQVAPQPVLPAVEAPAQPVQVAAQQAPPQPPVAPQIDAVLPLPDAPVAVAPPAPAVAPEQQRAFRPVVRQEPPVVAEEAPVISQRMYRRMLMMQPALFNQFIANNHVFPQAELELLPPFRSAMPAEITPLTANDIAHMMGYYISLDSQRRQEFVESIKYIRDTPFAPLQQARVVAHLDSFFGTDFRRPDLLNDADNAKCFSEMPFHIFAPHLPTLYRLTGHGIVNAFVHYSPTQMCLSRAEVTAFFNDSTRRPRADRVDGLKRMIMCLMMLVVPGQFPYTWLERLKNALENGPEVVVAGNNANQEPVVAGEEVPEAEVAEANGAVEDDAEEEAAPPRQEEEEEQQPQNVVDVPDDDVPANNEEVDALARQDRHQFVFQMEDLVPQPPARATRAARRRTNEAAIAAAPVAAAPVAAAPIAVALMDVALIPARRRGRPPNASRGLLHPVMLVAPRPPGQARGRGRPPKQARRT